MEGIDLFEFECMCDVSDSLVGNFLVFICVFVDDCEFEEVLGWWGFVFDVLFRVFYVNNEYVEVEDIFKYMLMSDVMCIVYMYNLLLILYEVCKEW